ncbi:hypothetical protein FB559_6969 [Actinoallomurus bryophytorum]|uniref:Uncharacterized protein n=1 Tax=Actinoallomurus bryophytorum TaxID=1490222 RepID=A0A543CVW5_9ACTN|nr:hypothetical protein FB559_6969 [Actinoallomurus bryophytorum]
MGLERAGVSAARRLGIFRKIDEYLREPLGSEPVAASADLGRSGYNWKPYGRLSLQSQSFVWDLEENGVTDLASGELGVTHLGELTSYFGGEVGVIQGPEGDLKLLKGGAERVWIPQELVDKGYRFIVHTHPVNHVPGELTQAERAAMVPSDMESDLEFRAASTETHVEAVVNKFGDVTYFDRLGILPAPAGWVPGGPVDHAGLVVPVSEPRATLSEAAHVRYAREEG